MAINLGEEQITVTRRLEIMSVLLNGLNTDNSKNMVISYMLDGEAREMSLSEDTYNDFYLNTWNTGKEILDLIKEKEGLGFDLDVADSEKQFVNIGIV